MWVVDLFLLGIIVAQGVRIDRLRRIVANIDGPARGRHRVKA